MCKQVGQHVVRHKYIVLALRFIVVANVFPIYADIAFALGDIVLCRFLISRPVPLNNTEQQPSGAN